MTGRFCGGDMPEFTSRVRSFIPTTMLLCLLASCGVQSPPPAAPSALAPAAAEDIGPGLGEIMSLQQMRHTKLWLAGQAKNWELASYEIEELGEGFDDVVKFHPTHKDSPVAPKDAIPRMVTQPLKDIAEAARKKDAKAFVASYDALTESCNGCHRAMNFGFNVVQRPATNPYPNQVFAVVQK
jgi:hypothetical protein